MNKNSTSKRSRLRCLGYLAVGVVSALLGLYLLLGMFVSSVEVMHSTSPDGDLSARVVEVNGGATTDFGYRIDVARNWRFRWHRTVASFDGAGRNDCAYGVNIRWANNNTLLITYKDAKQAHIHSPTNIFGRTVQIISRSGVDDPSASCGGMEYSQHGKIVEVR